MNKRILALFLAVALSFGTLYQANIHTQAASVTAGSYTAAKVFVALLAAAGVAISSENVEKIWNGGELDYSALISNMNTYSRGLGAAVSAVLSSGVAGATRLKMARDTWDLFKAWARGYFGVTTSSRNIFGTIKGEVKPIRAGQVVAVEYKVGPNYGSNTIRLDKYDCIVFRSAITSGGQIWRYEFTFVPVNIVQQNQTNDLFSSFSRLQSVNSQDTGGGIVYLGDGLGYGYSTSFGTNTSTRFDYFNINFPAYDLGAGEYQGLAGITGEAQRTATRNELIGLFRHTGKLSTADEVAASPAVTADGSAATADGKTLVNSGDVIGLDDTGEITIAGDVVLNLPLIDELADLLARLGSATTTYEQYVAALGAAAVDTSTMTAEEVQAAAEEISSTVNTPVGSYTVSLENFFPFCIPFDMYNLVAAFKAAPVTPSFVVHVPTGYDGHTFAWGDYTVSLAAFDGAAAVLRVMEYILFLIGLMLVSRKLIGG